MAALAIPIAVSIASSLLNKSKAPAAVPYQNVDPTQVNQSYISGVQSNLPAADTLASQSTTDLANSAVAARNITQPGYAGLASNVSKQATSLAADPYAVPQSVVDQLSQYAAENNISSGAGASSGFSQNNLLRSLGVNALQYGQSNLGLATSALSTLTGTAPNVSPVSPLSFMLSPQNALATTTNNNTQNQAIAQGASNANTAAQNQNSSNLWDTVTSQSGAIGSLASSLFGGGSGGGVSTSPLQSAPRN